MSMTLHVLGSSSAGNGYILDAEDGALVIEAGMPLHEVLRMTGYRLPHIKGCVVSHEHRDHARYAGEYMGMGVRVLALPSVLASACTWSNIFGTAAAPKHAYMIGAYKIIALPVAHDVPCLAFVIDHGEMGRLAFVTDTMMLEYKLSRVNHLLVEANYCDEILDRNISRGAVAAAERSRLTHSHMELKTAVGVAKANMWKGLSEIVLIHLSPRNSDAETFRGEMEKATGIPTYVARPGMKIQLKHKTV